MPKDQFGREIVSVEDLERMSPAERQAAFEERVVTDPALVPEEFRQRVAQRLAPLIAQRDREQALDPPPQSQT